MSLVVVNNYEDIFNPQNFLRIIIINSNLEGTERTIVNINKQLPETKISVITDNNLTKSYKNVEIILLNDNKTYLTKINELLLEKSEDFFCIMNSGDLILSSFNELFDNITDATSLGAIIFDNSTDETSNYKPGFSPDLYLETDYIHNSVLINKQAFNTVGGFDTRLPNNYIRDLILRLYYENYEIVKKDELSFKLNSNPEVYLDENNLILEKTSKKLKNVFDIITKNNILKPVYDTQNKKASIIIPFKDQSEVTKNCVESILKKTKYENFEIILINNNSFEEKTFQFIDEIKYNPKVKVYNYDNCFNWSKINNFGVSQSTGDVYIFLNNDTEVISPDWLSLMIGDAIQENTGVVGAKLFYPDETIQHAGVVIGLDSLASHLFSGISENEIPPLYKYYRRNVSSVTGACMAIEKQLFESINGFNERFEVSFSDIEICLRLLQLGYNNIFNPDIKLYHHEMKTRSKKEFREIDRILGFESFKYYFENGDPFFNRNYSLNNSTKLTLKKESEIPGFKHYWSNWSRNRNNRVNDIHSIINNKKHNKPIYNYDLSNDDLIKNGILMDKFYNYSELELNKILWFIPNFDELTEEILYRLMSLPAFLSETENSENIFVLSNDKHENKINSYIANNFKGLKYSIVKNLNFLDVDAAFCFSWQTAYKLLKFNECKSKYYILDEIYSDLNNKLKNQTYHFDFIGISDSKNFTNKYIAYNNSCSYFPPLINNSIYFYDENIKKINRSVLFHVNNFSDEEFNFIVEILKIIKEYFGNGIKIFIEGKQFKSNEYDLDNIVVNLGVMNSSRDLSNYYRQTQIVITLNSTQNLINKIFNSMACGCVNITNFNENLPTSLKNNENIILTQQTITSISEDIIRLLHDVNLREKIVKQGFSTLKQFNNQNTLNNMVNFIKNPNIITEIKKNQHNLENNMNKPQKIRITSEDEFIKKLIIENSYHKNNERKMKLINSKKKNSSLINRILDGIKNKG